MNDYLTSERGRDLIKQFEGYSANAYLCPAGKWTSGWGHTGPEVVRGYCVTVERAEQDLSKDLRTAEIGVQKLVKIPINQLQFDALVSFVYNLGVTAFANSTLLKKLNAKDFAGAGAQFLLWNKARTPKGLEALPGLTKRRTAEKDLFDLGTNLGGQGK